MTSTTTHHTALEHAAAHWLVRRQDGLSAPEERQFQAWLAQDAAHRQAYQALEFTWQRVAALPAFEIAQLQALARPMPPVVFAAPAASNPRRRAGWPHWAAQLASVAVVAGAGWFGWDLWQRQPVFSQEYATARGEVLDISLPDGSTLKLDTATRAGVTLYRQRREVRLAEGQAMFSVKPDPARPFDVLAGAVRISVVGTRFSVRNTRGGMGPDGVGIMVEQGRVRVSPLQREGGGDCAVSCSRYLTAGQYLEADVAGQLGQVALRPEAGALLWREGRVNFERTPLSQALAEFERYGATGLVIKDAAVGALRINGSFNLRQLDAFGKTLPLVLPVRLRVHAGATEIAAAP